MASPLAHFPASSRCCCRGGHVAPSSAKPRLSPGRCPVLPVTQATSGERNLYPLQRYPVVLRGGFVCP